MYVQKSFLCQKKGQWYLYVLAGSHLLRGAPVCIGTPSTLLFNAVSFDLSCVVAISLEANF